MTTLGHKRELPLEQIECVTIPRAYKSRNNYPLVYLEGFVKLFEFNKKIVFALK